MKRILVIVIALVAILAPTAFNAQMAEASSTPDCGAFVVHDRRGPGLKNWRAKDPFCDKYGNPGYGPWYGPWRYTSGGAWIDAERHNSAVL